MTTILYRVNKILFSGCHMMVVVSKKVFNQAVDKKREMLDMEEGQDMFDPEFYLAQYQVKNVKDRSMKTLCGRYRDVVSCGPGDELVTDRPECETSDRLVLYCVTPPGEAAWVVDQYRRIEGVEAGPEGPESIS